MIAEQIVNYIENWAPPGAAWEKDNVGLQVGSTKQKVANIFLCLELTDKSLNEAIKKKCNFIFTHHPFLFMPLKKIDTSLDNKAKQIEKLIKNNITLFSAHTNLDYTRDGVSFELARVLQLEDTRFLVNEKANQFKLVVFVPHEYLEKVADELFKAGAGIIGEYEQCSFSSSGLGTFLGSQHSNPVIGNKETSEKVDEARLETIVDSWKLNSVIQALKNIHPYEEPAYDVYPLQNENVNYGSGVIGSLKKSMTKNEFLNHICNSLSTKSLRYSNEKTKRIKKVAVCGGSCSEYLNAAINSGADAFITSDIKYHSFQEGEDRILFVDAGHYETEIHSLNVVKRKLENFIKQNKESVKVYRFAGSTNPVKYYNTKGVK